MRAMPVVHPMKRVRAIPRVSTRRAARATNSVSTINFARANPSARAVAAVRLKRPPAGGGPAPSPSVAPAAASEAGEASSPNGHVDPSIVIGDAPALKLLLRKDLRAAADSLTTEEARYLVDCYYQWQKFRIGTGNQVAALTKAVEPHAALTWTQARMLEMEGDIRAMLDVYTRTEPTGMAAWSRCAPPGSLVRVANGREIPIESLHDGDEVISFNRHHGTLTRPRPVQVGIIPWSGELIGVDTAQHLTYTTPQHKWFVRLARKDAGFSVYLMRAGDRFRVGRSMLFNRREKDYWRLRVSSRARQEHADVWVLRLFSTEAEAAVYEEYVATAYGLTEWPFRPPSVNRLIRETETDQLFALLNTHEQRERATRCLSDHGRSLAFPLWSWDGSLTTQSPTHGLVTASANLIPEIMEVPVAPDRYDKIEWTPIVDAPRRQHEGPVYSLDVAQHHKYVQDGLITCNSIVGIGPVLAAGFRAHLDVIPPPTVGHWWRFAGLDPTVEWRKGEKRPWNASLKLLQWKASESWVRTSGNPNDVYGHVYLERKAYEQAKNEAGEYAEQARAKLETFKIGADTEARGWYEKGLLPPAHIHARAKRYTSKLFIAHFWEEAYWRHYGKAPPLPYALVHLGHAHKIERPNPGGGL